MTNLASGYNIAVCMLRLCGSGCTLLCNCRHFHRCVQILGWVGEILAPRISRGYLMSLGLVLNYLHLCGRSLIVLDWLTL